MPATEFPALIPGKAFGPRKASARKRRDRRSLRGLKQGIYPPENSHGIGKLPILIGGTSTNRDLSIVVSSFQRCRIQEVSNRTIPERTLKKTWVSNSSIVTYWKVSVGKVQFNFLMDITKPTCARVKSLSLHLTLSLSLYIYIHTHVEYGEWSSQFSMTGNPSKGS